MQNMVMLIPGVTQAGGPPGTSVALNGGQFGRFPDPSHTLGSQVAVNGSQAASNVWYLDGSINAAQGVDNVVVNPVPDAVAEFQAITDGFAAEYGRTAGAVFNVIMKSGTNSVHGNLVSSIVRMTGRASPAVVVFWANSVRPSPSASVRPTP